MSLGLAATSCSADSTRGVLAPAVDTGRPTAAAGMVARDVAGASAAGAPTTPGAPAPTTTPTQPPTPNAPPMTASDASIAQPVPDATPQDGADAGAAPDAAQDAGEPIDAGQPAEPRRPRPITAGRITGPLSGGKGPSKLDEVDLGKHGYLESEYLLEGEATGYVAQGELGLDGAWVAAPSSKAAYKTRLLVRRPADAAKFNGTVFIEWLNVTLGKDTAVGFNFAWEELLRGGYAYAAVSVQQVGIDALKSDDPARYAGLVHPGDAYCYDMFSQAGAAIGWPGELDVLPGLRVERLIAYGQSQSAMRMITYVNAVQPKDQVFDGLIIHSRASWGAPVGTESDGFLGNGKPVRVRSDNRARVLQFLTETEVFLPLGPAFAARQPDNDYLRTWEVAGTAHADQHLLGDRDTGCGRVNAGPQHYVVKAAVHALQRWLTEGIAPPSGQPFEVTRRQDAIARDADGNALGGIRTPAVDVPSATLSGEPAGLNALNPLCLLYGHTVPFTPARLAALYPTHQDYVDKVAASARATREAGFILPEEEATIIAAAMAAPIPQ